MRLFLLVIGLMSFISSCNGQSGKWKEIESVGLEKPYSSAGIGTGYRFNQMILLDSIEGYLIGTYRNNDKIGDYTYLNEIKLSDAILLKTENKGAKWEEIKIANGDVINLSVNNEVFIANVAEFGTTEIPKVSSVYASTNKGLTWHKRFSFDTVVSDMFFWNELQGICWVLKKGLKAMLCLI